MKRKIEQNCEHTAGPDSQEWVGVPAVSHHWTCGIHSQQQDRESQSRSWDKIRQLHPALLPVGQESGAARLLLPPRTEGIRVKPSPDATPCVSRIFERLNHCPALLPPLTGHKRLPLDISPPGPSYTWGTSSLLTGCLGFCSWVKYSFHVVCLNQH